MKYVILTGGVVSSLGKGIATASIAQLLEARGLRINIIKLDPYINIDPGTMNPFEHGEVFVTDDGAEADLDLGHYERMTSITMGKINNATTGQIYNAVISRERAGEYLGKTVQVVPHITDEIKQRIRNVATDADVVLVEIGGTAGDIESLPFLEAVRQLRVEEGRANVMFVHLTLIPYIKAAGELKTKPTQHSVGTLRQIGIQPDMLLCRTERPLSEELQRKISLFCNVEQHAVIQACDVDTIYAIPLLFQEQQVDTLILEHLHLQAPAGSLSAWKSTVVERARNPERELRIAVVGKYINLPDAYKSIYEALIHAGIQHKTRVVIQAIDAQDLEQSTALLEQADGILIPGGFGQRGITGKIRAAQYARTQGVPFLGICLGMQVAVIEYARSVCGLHDAHSTEFDPTTTNPVINLLAEQRQVTQVGGSMRLGAYACALKLGSKAYKAYEKAAIQERHRHRYEFNSLYRDILESAGLHITGTNPETGLVEIIEIPEHPWFVACQYHPEFKSKPNKAHPLFASLIEHALIKQATKNKPFAQQAHTRVLI